MRYRSSTTLCSCIQIKMTSKNSGDFVIRGKWICWPAASSQWKGPHPAASDTVGIFWSEVNEVGCQIRLYLYTNMDLPGGYQGNFSLLVAPLPLHCCSAGNSLLPSVSPHPLSATSTPSASSGEPERRQDLRQNGEYAFSCIWPSPVGSPRGQWAGWKVGCLTHGCEGSAVSLPFTSGLHLSLASVEETSRTYNPIASRQGSWLKHIIKTSLHHCYSESIAFGAWRNKTRKHSMTEKVRTVTPILLVILCFSDPEKQSNFKYPVHFFFYSSRPYHWTESTFIYILVCTGTNQDKFSIDFKIQNSLHTIKMLGDI